MDRRNTSETSLKVQYRFLFLSDIFYKNSAITHQNSGSQFSRTTTGIQLGRGAFVESRLVMTTLTNAGVTEI